MSDRGAGLQTRLLWRPHGAGAQPRMQSAGLPAHRPRRDGLARPTRRGGANKWIEGPAPFALIQREIDAGRPVCVLIRWKNGGGGHFILIEGYSVSPRGVAAVWVRNPLSPGSSSRHPYDVIASNTEKGGYQDGQGRWSYTFLVQPPANRPAP